MEKFVTRYLGFILTIVEIILIALKITDVIKWDWIIVLLPIEIILSWGILIVIICGIMTLKLFSDLDNTFFKSKKHRNK
jgi:hypothetical protein